MIMNPDRAKDLGDMMNKLDRWDAPIRDNEMSVTLVELEDDPQRTVKTFRMLI